MFLPTVAGQHARHGQEAGQADSHGGYHAVFLGQLADQVDEGNHAETNPDGEGVERAGITVVALAGLLWGLVEVDDDGQAGHEEEQEDDPTLLQVVLEQPEEANQTEDEGQEIIGRAARIMQAGRDVVLVAEAGIVDGTDATEPVAVGQFALAFDVVLAANEVPHKVAPIHPIALVVDEELQILPEGGLGDGEHFAPIVPDAHRRAHDGSVLVLAIVLIEGLLVPVPHAREEGLHLGGIVGLAALAIASDDVSASLFVLHVNWAVINPVGNGCIVISPVHQRPLAVLVAVDVSQHRKGFLGLVLVDGCVGVGPDNQHEER